MNKKNLLVGIVVTLVGLLVMIFAGAASKAIVILLGLEAVLNGFYCLMFTRKLIPDSSFQNSVIIRAMISIVVGLCAVIFPVKIQTLWETMLIVIGIYLIVSSLLEAYAIGKLRETEIDRKNFISETLFSLLLAVLLFIFTKNIVRIAGAVTFLAGVAYLFVQWKNKPLVQEPVEVVDDVTGDISSGDN